MFGSASLSPSESESSNIASAAFVLAMASARAVSLPLLCDSALSGDRGEAAVAGFAGLAGPAGDAFGEAAALDPPERGLACDLTLCGPLFGVAFSEAGAPVMPKGVRQVSAHEKQQHSTRAGGTTLTAGGHKATDTGLTPPCHRHMVIATNLSSLFDLLHCSIPQTRTKCCREWGGGGLRSGIVKSNCEKLRKICGTIGGSSPNLPKPLGAILWHRGHTGHQQAREGDSRTPLLKKIPGKSRKFAKYCEEMRKLRKTGDLNPLCDILCSCCFFAGPWTITRSSLRMLRRVAAFCQPLRPVLLLVSFPRSRGPAVGVLGLCWMWQGVPFVPPPPLLTACIMHKSVSRCPCVRWTVRSWCGGHRGLTPRQPPHGTCPVALANVSATCTIRMPHKGVLWLSGLPG